MEGGDGMVAVVRGLQNAGLAVTLLEGCRQYTLVRNSVPQPMATCVHVTRDVPESMPATADVCTEPVLCCDSSVQTTDGRYSSIYKVARCNVSPTSPPVHLTEFQPQRAELTPGSVCASRSSYEPDSVTNSLRKYPNMSPQRSSEIVERLVNYTLAENASQISGTNRLSPTKLSQCNSNHTLDRDSRVSPTRRKCYEPEVTVRPRVKTDESPTREGRPKRCDTTSPELNATAFCRNFEVRCLRDISKKTRNSPRNVAEQNTTSVNMAIQAVVEKMSREVATLPRVESSKRNVAIPLSPISSNTLRCPEAQFAVFPASFDFKSVQTIPANITTKSLKKEKKFVQATSSSIELLRVDRCQCNERIGRKSKSQEEIRTRKDDFRKEMLQLLKNIDCHGDEVCQAFRDEIVRKIKTNRRKLNLNIDGRAKSAPFWFKARPTCRNCVHNYRTVKKFDVFRSATRNMGVPYEDNLRNTVKDWIQEIHTYNSKILERLSLNNIVNSLFTKLSSLCSNFEAISKSQIMKMIEEVSFDASDSNRNVHLNNLADELTKKIKDVLHCSDKQFKRYRNRKKTIKNKKVACFPFRKLIQPTEEEVRGFIREKLLVFIDKFHLNLNMQSVFYVETEVTDVLIDSIDELQWGDNDKVKKDIAIVLRETCQLPEYFCTCLADTLVNIFKRFMRDFSTLNTEKIECQTFLVFQNTVQNASIQPNEPGDISIEPVTAADVEAHIEQYTSQLTQVIEAWWTSILGADENEKGFREVAINDLAGDIVDRQRFLGMNNSLLSSNEDEIEYLKFQIFRWINKLVGDEAMQQALDQAPELMQQIQRIPVPAMSMPDSPIRSQNAVERPRSPPQVRTTNPARVAPTNPDNVNQSLTFGSAGRSVNLSGGSKKCGPTGRRMSEPSHSMGLKKSGGVSGASQGRRLSLSGNIVSPIENLNTAMPTISKINAEVQAYFSDWTYQIPIAENNPHERELAKKLREGIFKGLIIAYLKAEVNSAQFKNEFYLQDYFEKEVEELLSCLPSTPELNSKKSLLKTNLIQRITIAIKAMIHVNTSTPYKYRLWDALTCILPPRPKVEERNKSNAQLYEELLILNIVEDYILYRLHENMNRPKSEAHRQKLFTSIQKLYENAKLLPGSERITDNVDDFTTKAFHILLQVDMPPRDTLQDEGDQIVLGLEIAQWLQDLPIAQSDAHSVQLQRRRLRDSLAKKIHEIEKQTNLCDNSAMRQVKNELSNFLQKFSPRPEEAGNLSFLIDEFINRLKNKREKVEGVIAFPWFVKQIPFSSSVVKNSGEIFLPESFDDEWANLEPSGLHGSHILGAGNVPGVLPYKEPTNTQYFTLLDTQERLEREREAQAPAAPSQQVPACCQPAVATSLRSQAISGNLSQNEQTPYQEPSNVEWLTMLDTQERLEREREAQAPAAPSKQVPACCQPAVATSLRSQAISGNLSQNEQIPYQEPSNVEWLTMLDTQEQIERDKKAQIPSCCQPALTTSQKAYGAMRSGVIHEPVARADARSFHTSQLAGSIHPLAGARRQVGATSAAPMMHSEMRRLVDLQDQRLSMMQGAIPVAYPGPSGVASFLPPPAQPVIQMPSIPNVNGILRTSQMPGPSGVAGPNLAGSVRRRHIGSPQQVMAGGSPSNRSQLQFAAPLAQHEAEFAPRHDLEAIPEQNISRPIFSPLDMSMQAPVGFSTPRQSLLGRAGGPQIPSPANVPGAPRARRKRTCDGEANPETACRRLDLEEVEEEEERDEVQCRCTERVYRSRRRRPMCCDCEDMDYPRYYPMPYPYCYF